MKFYTATALPTYPEMPDLPGEIRAACLDCRWGTASFRMDTLINEVHTHEWVYGHLVHIWD